MPLELSFILNYHCILCDILKLDLDAQKGHKYHITHLARFDEARMNYPRKAIAGKNIP